MISKSNWGLSWWDQLSLTSEVARKKSIINKNITHMVIKIPSSKSPSGKGVHVGEVKQKLEYEALQPNAYLTELRDLLFSDTFSVF